MLHNQDSKSKEENHHQPARETACRESEFHVDAPKEKGRLLSGLPFRVRRTVDWVLVGFLSDKCRHVEIFGP